MATKVSIISHAFILLGTKAVNDIQTGNPTYAAVASLYDSLLRAELSAHRWGFATITAVLNRLTSTPPLEEWDYIFQLPANMLRIWRTYPLTDYAVYEDKLYTNSNLLTLEYVYEPDESKFPAYFELLMIERLAAHAAMTVTQNPAIAKLWMANAEERSRQAKYLDSQNYPTRPIQRDALYAAHFRASTLR